MYSANVKARAMAARLLTAAGYQALTRMATAGQKIWLRDNPHCGHAAVLEDARKLACHIHERWAKNIITKLGHGLAEGDMGVDFYLSLWREIPRGHALGAILAMEIDLRNILWMYRLKHSFGVDGQEIFGHLIPLGSGFIKKMAMTKGVSGLLEEVSGSKYAGVFPDFNHAEHRLATAMQQKYRNESRKHPNTIIPLCGYLFEKYLESRKISAIMENTRKGNIA